MTFNPGVLEMLNSAQLVEAVSSILGADWAIVPYANSVIEADRGDQHWHKDDIFPWNARKPGLRQHHLEHLNLFYYPQDVTEMMGPTAMIPYSHYWTVDHDENNQNICIEMLHPISMMSIPDKTERDARLNSVITETGWPLVRQIQACARGGSVTLMSQNVFHRRNRRRDGVEGIEEKPRYMWRFMCYRTTEPSRSGAAGADATATAAAIDQSDTGSAGVSTGSSAGDLVEAYVARGKDELTGATLEREGEAGVACSVWASVLGWARGETIAPLEIGVNEAKELRELTERLTAKGVGSEPVRIDAAYQLGALANATFEDCSGLFAATMPSQAALNATAALGDAMSHSWEGVRRAATHGLIAAGGDCDAAVRALLPLCEPSFPSKFVRKNAAFALGEMAYPTPEVVDALAALLRTDDSVHVRGTVATALGGVGRRASAMPGADAAAAAAAAESCLQALLECLATEENRIGQDISQGVGPYDFRPTDESDLCEGASGAASQVSDVPKLSGGGEAEAQRFEKVRSGVKEAAGWGVVTLCTHAAVLPAEALHQASASLHEVIVSDNNVIVVGFAMDALCR
jgi:hypothetical protein